MMKKRMIVILTVLLIFSISVQPAFAMSTDAFANENLQVNPLEGSKLLMRSDIIKIADYYIDDFVENSQENKEDKAFSGSNQFIELYDINDNLFAYIVPILDE